MQKLYQIAITRRTEIQTVYVVAPSEHDAVLMTIDRELIHGRGYERFSAERLDERLPADRQQRLDHVLHGPAGFVVFTSLGWVLDQQVDLHLHLFRIVTPAGNETFVVAADDTEAAAIYMAARPLDNDSYERFKIIDAVPDLTSEQQAEIGAILDCGPRGIVTWTGKRWQQAAQG